MQGVFAVGEPEKMAAMEKILEQSGAAWASDGTDGKRRQLGVR